MKARIRELQERGVRLLQPETLYLAPEVDLGRIAPGVSIYPGVRLEGAALSIGPDSEIGREAPVTINECQIGADVVLAGGYFDHATLLNGFRAGSGAHVRPGSLFEECSSIAHCVGVKQTIFMPWVTSGSLVNFCDVLMAGGSGYQAHSEVGSSYIHFNFTPNQDKATASLLGDVPRGVLLNQAPIFLGGQGGLVGPVVIAYGTVLAAGQVWRGDVEAQGRLLCRSGTAAINVPYGGERYAGLRRILRNNLRYIGNLLALRLWYRLVRARFMLGDPFQAACHAGALCRLAEVLEERLFRLDELAGKVEALPLEDGEVNPEEPRREFVTRWPAARRRLEALAERLELAELPAGLAPALAALSPEMGYLEAIQGLAPMDAQRITAWLEPVVEEALATFFEKS